MAFPPEWVNKKLGEISLAQSGAGFPKSMQGEDSGDYPLAKVSDITIAVNENGGNLQKAKNYLSAHKAKKIGAKVLPVGTTLFAKIGEAVRLNRRAIAMVPTLADNNVMGLIPRKEIFPKYLYYFMHTIDLYEYSQATTVPSVRKTDIESINIPIPPIPDQERIVERIESLFTQLDAGVAALKRAQVALKRYRASMLKAACEGRLVPQDPDDEPAEELLKRILAENGIKTQPVKLESKSEVPRGWTTGKIEWLFQVSYGLSESLVKTEPDNELDIPIIRIPNITEFGYLNLSKLKYFPIPLRSKEKFLLHKGDLLFNWRNAPKWIGRSAVFKSDGEYINASFLLKFRPYKIGYSDFIAVYMNYLRLDGYFMTIVNNAVNQANFNANRAQQMIVPIPPISEQNRILAEVDRRFSVVEEMESALAAGLARASRLRQSILKLAFEGRLLSNNNL